MKNTFAERVCNSLDRAQALYKERNAVYKDNFRVVGTVMRALFPKQPRLETEQDFNRWHIFELFIVKLTRYAANWHDGGHRDSLEDMIVYLGMLIELDREWNNPLKEPDEPSIQEWASESDTAESAEEKYQDSVHRSQMPWDRPDFQKRVIKDSPQA